MPRARRPALLVAAVLALAGCGKDDAPTKSAAAPATAAPKSDGATPPGRPMPTEPGQKELFEALVPKGVPTQANGQPAKQADLAVVKRWLAALTQGDIPKAAGTFADGAVVQNLNPPVILEDEAARLAFNAGFPCGAEIVTASSVKGYLIVTYRLTDRESSACDGPGGSAAGAIKVEGGKMTEWYRLPDPQDGKGGAGAAPVV